MAIATETAAPSRTGTTTPVVTAPVRDPGKDKSQEKEPSEKEKADQELKDRLEREGPSPLKVVSTPSESDRLREEGIEVVLCATAPLPGEGPANEYGMSHGFDQPSEEKIDQVLMTQKNEREEKKSKEGKDGRLEKQEQREKRFKETDEGKAQEKQKQQREQKSKEGDKSKEADKTQQQQKPTGK